MTHSISCSFPQIPQNSAFLLKFFISPCVLLCSCASCIKLCSCPRVLSQEFSCSPAKTGNLPFPILLSSLLYHDDPLFQPHCAQMWLWVNMQRASESLQTAPQRKGKKSRRVGEWEAGWRIDLGGEVMTSSPLPPSWGCSQNALSAQRKKEEMTRQTGSPSRWPVPKVGVARSGVCEALLYVSLGSCSAVLAVWDRKQLWGARLKPAACSRLRLWLRYVPVSIKLREAWLPLSWKSHMMFARSRRHGLPLTRLPTPDEGQGENALMELPLLVVLRRQNIRNVVWLWPEKVNNWRSLSQMNEVWSIRREYFEPEGLQRGRVTLCKSVTPLSRSGHITRLDGSSAAF